MATTSSAENYEVVEIPWGFELFPTLRRTIRRF